LVGCILAAVLAVCGLYPGIVGLDAVTDLLFWRSRTTPLSPSVVRDLCSKLSVPASDRRCNLDSRSYAPEFFPEIYSQLLPDDGPAADAGQVDRLLGPYRYAEEPVSVLSDGTAFYSVGYDLQGDRVFPIRVYFYSDGLVWRVVGGVGTTP
jgi:hypothetical protein